MREIRVEKVVLNVGCGGDRDKIERALKLLNYLAGKKPIVTLSRKRSTFGIARGRPVGVKLTLRGKDALKFLELVFKAKGYKLKKSQIDKTGNFSIGIKEYIDLPNVKYKHDIGMLGLDVCISLERPGFRVKRRRVKRAKIGRSHLLNKEEVIKWLKDKFNVEIENGG